MTFATAAQGLPSGNVLSSVCRTFVCLVFLLGYRSLTLIPDIKYCFIKMVEAYMSSYVNIKTVTVNRKSKYPLLCWCLSGDGEEEGVRGKPLYSPWCAY